MTIQPIAHWKAKQTEQNLHDFPAHIQFLPPTTTKADPTNQNNKEGREHRGANSLNYLLGTFWDVWLFFKTEQ